MEGPGPDGGGAGDAAAATDDLGVATPDGGSFPTGDLGWPGPVGTATYPVVIPRTNINASAAPGAQLGGDLAIDPTNLPYFNHLIGASENTATDQVGLYETNDGATNWRTHVLLPPSGIYTGATRHPSVAFDTQGNAFCSLIAYDPSGTMSTVALTTRLATSTSGFGKLVVIPGTSADRQRIAVDRTVGSPYRDRLYVAWTDGQHVHLASSSDAGASFNAGVQVDDDGTMVSNPYVTSAADGAVYVAWLDVPRSQLRIDRSSDGGMTWGTDHVVHQLVSGGLASPTAAAPSSGARNIIACDVMRANSPLHGAVYCAYHDAASGNGLDVFLRRSGDGGASWSEPLRMSDDPIGVPVDQFLPRVMIDDGNGKVNVAWYDTRDDPAHLKTNVYYTRANDGSAFVAPVKITTQQTDETRPGADPLAYGESIGMEAFLGRVRLLWTDSRTGDEDVFSLIIDFAHFQFIYPGSDTVTVPAGGSGTMAVGVQPVGAFAEPVMMSTLDLPPGATATWSVNPLPENGTSTLTVSAAGATPGSYTARVKGIAAGEQDSRAFTLVIQ
jgi:hypothetical protein